jgi:hypothetical protein
MSTPSDRAREQITPTEPAVDPVIRAISAVLNPSRAKVMMRSAFVAPLTVTDTGTGLTEASNWAPNASDVGKSLAIASSFPKMQHFSAVLDRAGRLTCGAQTASFGRSDPQPYGDMID